MVKWQKILGHLQRYGYIDAPYAASVFREYSLPSVIARLRRKGHDIQLEKVKGVKKAPRNRYKYIKPQTHASTQIS